MKDAIREAGASGKLLASTVEQLENWISSGILPQWARDSLQELVDGGHWDELNNRFYKALEFGTGGMRGRTIGMVVTKAERGTPGPKDTPAHAALGSAVLNDFNVIRATIGLFRYSDRYLRQKHGRREIPRLVIAHDVRHFSRYFCELVASTWTRLGGYAMIFDGPRSTPQLSFTVRHVGATAGVVITASHNPSHDNGYKVYFEDGAQVVYPHAEGIINEVYKVALTELPQHLEVDIANVVTLDAAADTAYMEAVEENILDAAVMKRAAPKVVFTAIHGTGGVTAPALMRRFGIDVTEVAEQAVQDPRFPTVKSPNPENAEALSMAIAEARRCGAEVVMATDPDSDRMGVAVRDASGEMVLLSGNQIGSLLAAYRVETLRRMDILPAGGTANAAVIKTFVTTPLQESIARRNGLKVINTLTGFKWIGEKLAAYEAQIKDACFRETGVAMDYDRSSLGARRRLALAHSTYYVFGGEESYGYLASDRVRDKDANAAVLMFCELVAALKDAGKTVTDYLDEVYLRYGYYLEGLVNLYYEGASGAAKIQRILESYRANPPQQIGDFGVTEFKDFGRQTLHDDDGKEIPKQDFYFLELDNGYRYAVRGSGTEPKIKFYVFACEDVSEPAGLQDAKDKASATIEAIKAAIEADARARAEG